MYICGSEVIINQICIPPHADELFETHENRLSWQSFFAAVEFEELFEHWQVQVQNHVVEFVPEHGVPPFLKVVRLVVQVLQKVVAVEMDQCGVEAFELLVTHESVFDYSNKYF
jgi:hypothetical protein